jgi:hypothetical protein
MSAAARPEDPGAATITLRGTPPNLLIWTYFAALAAGQGVLVQLASRLMVSQRAQVGSEVARGAQGVRMILAQHPPGGGVYVRADAAVARQGLSLLFNLGCPDSRG